MEPPPPPPPLERTPTPHPNQILQSCGPIPTDQTHTPLERTPTPHPSNIPRPSCTDQTQTPPPPQPLERTPTPHPNQILQQAPPCGTCLKCGSPTTYTPPPPVPQLLPSLSETSPPPSYRPIRMPALNISPSAAAQAQQAIILTPVPQPLPVPTLSPPFHFTPPIKRITSPSDANRFITSFTGQHFLGFIASLSLSIKSQKLSSPCHVSSPVTLILETLTELISSIDQFPPVDQSSRYGNTSFRSWHQNLTSLSQQYNLKLLPDDNIKGAVAELAAYFNDSFGNATRIDYGTGHETNFAAWLYCLARLGVIKEEDYQAVVSRVFVKYLELMRKLQLVYCLEPAGSHGVWGLDDYHFLPFVFGASQLIDHKYMKPKSIHNEDILENFAEEYLYLQCVKFVKKVKKGPFAEHSPLLDDISGVPNWGKVNSGLLKMYRAEVLEKVPVVQHFLFGSIIPWD